MSYVIIALWLIVVIVPLIALATIIEKAIRGCFHRWAIECRSGRHRICTYCKQRQERIRPDLPFWRNIGEGE